MQSIIYWLKWLLTKTYPAGRVLGIPLRVHLFMLIFLPMLAFGSITNMMSQMPGQTALALIYGLLFFLIFVGVLYGSVLAHEFGHAWGTRLVGETTDHILMTPIGGLHIRYGADSSPKTELIIVALGPAVTILLCIIGAVLYFGYIALVDHFEWYNTPSFFLEYFFEMLFYLNLIGALFNLLTPVFPLDCAKLLRAAFSLKYNPQKVTLFLTRLGIGLAIFLIFISLTGVVTIPVIGRGGVWISIIAILGITSCLQEQQRIQYQDVYSKSDEWGGRQVYYDSDIMSYARRRAAADLGPFGMLIPRSGGTVTAPSRKGTIKKSERVKAAHREQQAAEVIDISLDQDPSEVTDKEVLMQMMKKAADTENFQLAAAVKKRLRELE